MQFRNRLPQPQLLSGAVQFCEATLLICHPSDEVAVATEECGLALDLSSRPERSGAEGPALNLSSRATSVARSGEPALSLPKGTCFRFVIPSDERSEEWRACPE